MSANSITERLFLIRDEKYADFQTRLIPTVPGDRIIGVRTPELRALAREIIKEGGAEPFLLSLPHTYFEENQLHAFIISYGKDFDICVSHVEAFLPYIDNWATCDQMSPRVFGKHPEKLLPRVREWLGSGKEYTVRYAIGILMRYFLDDRFDTAYPDAVASLETEDYYVRTMVAWYFATALAKQYEQVIPYFENGSLDAATLAIAVRKSVESFRIPDERKAHLRSLVNREKNNENGQS